MSLIVNVFVYLTIILKLFFAVFNGFIIAFIVAFLTKRIVCTKRLVGQVRLRSIENELR